MKKSAGILVYRKRDGIEVFLEHMGGPYYQAKEKGAWSIPKGEYVDEKPLEAALREFQEESGLTITNTPEFLKTVKQSSGKLVTVFLVEEDLDETKMKSNTFTLEWPPKSGKIETFPEMDKAAWFTIKDAKDYILKGQIPFLEQLEKRFEE